MLPQKLFQNKVSLQCEYPNIKGKEMKPIQLEKRFLLTKTKCPKSINAKKKIKKLVYVQTWICAVNE